MNSEEFKIAAQAMVEFITKYLDGLPHRHKVLYDVQPNYLAPLMPGKAPTQPDSFDNIMRDLDPFIIKGLLHWQHPNFHAFFPSGNGYPSILADMLSGAVGTVGLNWQASPSMLELELVMMDWLADAMGLPHTMKHSAPGSIGGGILMGSASECTFTAMVVAREQAIRYFHGEPVKEFDDIEAAERLEICSKLVCYTSVEAHSSQHKASRIAGVRMRLLSTDERGRLTADIVQKAMDEDVARGFHPFFVGATLGTTGLTVVDKLYELGELISKRPACWFHVDGAYAGSALLLKEEQDPRKGLTRLLTFVDSFNFNPNKWMLTAFDASCFWVVDHKKVTDLMRIDPVYLESSGPESLANWTLPLSRRFRALKIWFTLRLNGINRIQAYLRNHRQLAKYLEGVIRRDDRLEIVNEVNFGLVCFRLVRIPSVKADENELNNINTALVTCINAEGLVHLTPNKTRDKYYVRMCINHVAPTRETIDKSWSIIIKHIDNICSRIIRQPTPRPLSEEQKKEIFHLARVQYIPEDQYNSMRPRLRDLQSVIYLPDPYTTLAAPCMAKSS